VIASHPSGRAGPHQYRRPAAVTRATRPRGSTGARVRVRGKARARARARGRARARARLRARLRARPRGWIGNP